MKILTSFEQGTSEWKAARAGKVTASRAKDARSRLKSGLPSSEQKKYAAQIAVERISKQPMDDVFETWQMREGTKQEPFARQAYEEATGNLVEEVGAIATDDELFLYSPDGLCGDDGLVEIKSLFSADRMLQIVAEGDLGDFIDQCMFGLWLTGRKWIDLVIWCPALESIGLKLTIRRIHRDENEIEALEADLMAFAKTVREAESKFLKVAKASANADQLALVA